METRNGVVKCHSKYPMELRDQPTNIHDKSGRAQFYRPFSDPVDFRYFYKGRQIETKVDNSWVVPYSPYLLMRLRSHINVDYCTVASVVLYIYKYIYKGSDRAVTTVQAVHQAAHGQEHLITIEEASSARYLSSAEAAWDTWLFTGSTATHPSLTFPFTWTMTMSTWRRKTLPWTSWTSSQTKH